MMRLSCTRARSLMDRRMEGLSEPDRLRVESHTASCAACADHGAMLAGLVTLARAMPTPSNEAAQRRVIERALDQSSVAQPAEAPALAWPRWAPMGVVAAMAVAAAALVMWVGPTVPSDSATAWRVAPGTPQVERFESVQPKRVSIAGAILDLEANTSVEWDQANARITLSRGALRAKVESRLGKSPLSVRTPRFDVVVVGTDFDVTLQSVRVHEGVVRVQDLAGHMLRAALTPGQGWSIDAREQAAVAASNELAANDPQSPQPARGEPAERDASRLIDEARALLSTGDVVAARRLLHSAEQLPLAIGQRLEMETLVAEAHQVAGNNRRAVVQYDRVVRRQPSSVAADNAQFAAARLTLSSGDRIAAENRFRKYLLQRPSGRFRVEVERALDRLTRGRATPER